MTKSGCKKILSVSSDLSLLKTREGLLKMAGYKVISVLADSGDLESVKRCHYQLAIFGHSIARSRKRQLIHEVRQCKERVRILSLLRHGEDPLAEADYAIEANEGPAALIEVVHKICAELDNKGQGPSPR